MEIGRYYENQHLYEAAIGRFQRVVDDYQTTNHVPEALHRLTEIYLLLGLTDQAKVTAAVLGGMVWAIENPWAGVVEADQLDHTRVLAVAEPYLGDMVGAYSDWTPLLGRARLFPEDIDVSCPWQFGNFRVI